MPARIAGIQPGYLPWLGYFDQMRRVDAFVIADEMQFSSSGWAHRNRVRGPEGAHWLTLPARPARGQAIRDVPLDPQVPWKVKHLETLRHFYARSPAAAELLEHWPAAAPPLLVSSFSLPALHAFRQAAPGIPLGLLVERVPRNWAQVMVEFGCTTLHPWYLPTRAAIVRDLTARGVPVLPYTVNDPARAMKLLVAGARAIITDVPDRMVALNWGAGAGLTAIS